MRLFDTHCHLDFSALQPIADRLVNWRSLGIQQFVVPSIGPSNWQPVLELSQHYQCIAPALGIHPCFLTQHEDYSSLAHWVEIHQHHLVAIGECGLDRRFSKNLAQQEAIFIRQLQLAQHYNLPVIIHSVRMHDEVFSLLKQYPVPAGGVIHAFQGSQIQAQRFIAQGFKLGIGGAICWPSAEKLCQVIAQLPVASLVIETDAPDMPLPHMAKGENSPASLLTIIRKLAKIYSIEVGYLSEILYKNSENLFLAR